MQAPSLTKTCSILFRIGAVSHAGSELSAVVTKGQCSVMIRMCAHLLGWQPLTTAADETACFPIVSDLGSEKLAYRLQTKAERHLKHHTQLKIAATLVCFEKSSLPKASLGTQQSLDCSTIQPRLTRAAWRSGRGQSWLSAAEFRENAFAIEQQRQSYLSYID